MPSPEKQRVIVARLGMRFNKLFTPIDINGVTDVLTKLNYRDIENTDNQSIRASKNNVDFYFERMTKVFGFNSRKFENTITAQKDFFSVVKRDLHTNLAEFIMFYEIEYVSDYFSDKQVSDLFSTLYSDSSLMNQFENIIGAPVRVNGINLVSREGTYDDSKWYSVIVEPKIESGNNIYFCRIVYRSNSSDQVYSMGRRCPEILEKLISKLE